MATEAVYFLAIRTTTEKSGAEIQVAMKALNAVGLLPGAGGAPDNYHAVAWYRPYAELTANDHHRLRDLGLDFADANRIATVVSDLEGRNG